MKRLRVLVVDDDLLARSLLRGMRLPKTIVCQTVNRVPEALALIESDREAEWFVVTGHALEPGFPTGMDLIKAIRAMNPPVSAYLSLLSMHAAHLRVQAFEEKVQIDALLQKPDGMPALQDRVHRWMRSFSP